jgi:hypothetical protein
MVLKAPICRSGNSCITTTSEFFCQLYIKRNISKP